MILTGAGGLNSFVQFITVLILFFFVLVVTYYVTRWMAGFQKAQMTGTNMEIIDTMRISQNKYLQIIRTGDHYLVIAVCKDTVTMLTELSADSIVLPENMNNQNISFKDVFTKVKNHVDGIKNSTKIEK